MYRTLKCKNNTDNKNFGDVIIPYINSINGEGFSLKNNKDKLYDKIFGIKIYEDGSSYSGFLDETKNEIISHSIYKDGEGRRLLGKFINFNI